MRHFYVLVDNSTKPRLLGKSCACWAVFKDNYNSKPLRIGLIFLNYKFGTQQAFYLGVIKALEDCFILGGSDVAFHILGDCQTVIKLLRGEWQPHKLAPFHAQVQGLLNKYRDNKRGMVAFDYINEETPSYKFVDIISQRSHNTIEAELFRCTSTT